MPYSGSVFANGNHSVPNMKSNTGILVKNITVSTINVQTIPNVVSTDTDAIKKRIIGINFSIIFFCFLLLDFCNKLLN